MKPLTVMILGLVVLLGAALAERYRLVTALVLWVLEQLPVA